MDAIGAPGALDLELLSRCLMDWRLTSDLAGTHESFPLVFSTWVAVQVPGSHFVNMDADLR